MDILVTLFVCVWSVSTSPKVTAQDDHFIRRLHDELISPNNPWIRPVRNSSHSMTIYMNFNLVSISSFDEVSQTVVSNGFFIVTWEDQFLRWNSSEYGGVTKITPDASKVWVPYLTIQNTVDKIEPMGQDFKFVQIESSGQVTWTPGETFQLFCSLDVTNFPFDEQTCTYRLFEWGSNLDLLDLQQMQSTISLSVYNKNSEWAIKKTRCYRTLVNNGANQIPFLHFSMTLKRNPALKVLTIMLPVLILNLLNVVVFLIPVESGEKLSFAITVLLSFTVFMSFISNMLPQSGDSLSVLTVFLTTQFILSSLYVLLTVWTISLFHRDPSNCNSPSPWMIRLARAVDRLPSSEPSAVGDVAIISKRSGKENAWKNQHRSWIQISRAIDWVMFWIFMPLFIISATGALLKITDI